MTRAIGFENCTFYVVSLILTVHVQRLMVLQSFYVMICFWFQKIQKELSIVVVFSFVVCDRLVCLNVSFFCCVYFFINELFLFCSVGVQIQNNGIQSESQRKR